MHQHYIKNRKKPKLGFKNLSEKARKLDKKDTHRNVREWLNLRIYLNMSIQVTYDRGNPNRQNISKLDNYLTLRLSEVHNNKHRLNFQFLPHYLHTDINVKRTSTALYNHQLLDTIHLRLGIFPTGYHLTIMGRLPHDYYHWCPSV